MPAEFAKGDAVRYIGPSLRPARARLQLLRVARVGEYAGQARVFVEYTPALHDPRQRMRERPIRPEDLELVKKAAKK